MAQSGEKHIEDALVSAIGSLTYIAANGVSVRSDDNMSVEKAAAMVNVAVQKAERIAPNYNYYRAPVEIGTITHIPNDENDVVGENVYDEVNDYVQALTVSALNALVTESEVTIDGIVPGVNEDSYDDKFRVFSTRFDCYYTYTTT